jgi:hypothetical protein
MQNGISQPVLGTQRDFPCVRCTRSHSRAKVRQHVYSEYRAARHVERFWECSACGHHLPISIWDELRDAATERLHAQWRQDNAGRIP